MKLPIGVFSRLLALFGAVALVGWTWIRTTTVDSAVGERISALMVAPAFIDLGAVTSSQSEVSYSITNQSDADVQILGLQTSCGCMNARSDRYQIRRGESARVTATIRHNRMGAGAEIPFSRSVTVQTATNGEVTALHLNARGRFHPAAWIEDQRAELKQSGKSGECAAEIPVFLRSNPPVAITDTDVSGRDLDCTAEVADIAEIGRLDSDIAFVRATVRVRGVTQKLPAMGYLTVATDSPETPEIRITLVCPSNHTSAASSAPETLAFGVLKRGQVATRRTVISWNRDGNTRSIEAQVSDGFKVQGIQEVRTSGTRHVCPIEIATIGPVVKLGELTGHVTVKLRSDADSATTSEIRIPISGFVKSEYEEPEITR